MDEIWCYDNKISKEIIKKSFKVCGICIEMGGIEDDLVPIPDEFCDFIENNLQNDEDDEDDDEYEKDVNNSKIQK